jgi:hypothetical protein
MSSKPDKAKLAKGAEKIRRAQAQLFHPVQHVETAAKATPLSVAIPEPARPMLEIVKQRVQILDGNIGLKLADDTTLDESLVILDWVTLWSDHVGFMIGDVLNFSQHKWGDKYTQALNETGRAKSTLQQYASVAARIPLEQRNSSLTFWQHELILRTPEDHGYLLRRPKQAEDGDAPTVKELRIKVRKLTPKRVTSGKGKKKPVKEQPPYEPTPLEQERLDHVEEALKTATKVIKDNDPFPVAVKLDNTEKRRWLSITEPIVAFHKALEKAIF